MKSLTKEKLLSLSHGVIRAHDQDSVASEDKGSDYIENPARWENNAARKQLDMQWHFTCGPLRVAELTGKDHWNRLHSSNISAIPQPGGGVHVMTSSIPHKSDAELEAQAAKIGVSHRALRKSQGLPPLPPREGLSTPMMRTILKDTSAPAVPRRSLSSRQSNAFTDGSSAFSRTTVASTSKGAATVKQCAPELRSGGRGGTSVASFKSNNVQTKNTDVASRVESRASSVGGLSRASNTSRRSAAESIRVDLERERAAKRDLSSELMQAAQRLAALEAILREDAAQ